MNEFDSPNYTEFVCDKKIEGKGKLFKYLLIFGYISFVVAFFLVCYISRIVTVFAVAPIVTWILIHFTWRLVKFDIYYTFEHGKMTFGRIKKRKSGNIRVPRLIVNVQSALAVKKYSEVKDSEKFKSVARVHDYSPTITSPNLIVIFFERGKSKEAVILENIPRLEYLLPKYFTPKDED